MAKKDGQKNTDVKKQATEVENSNNSNNTSEEEDNVTKVKNAHAVGLGAIGRNDQPLDSENTDDGKY